MKNFIILSTTLLLLSACAKQELSGPALGYTELPKKVNLDSVGPNITPAMDPSGDKKLTDYPSIQLDPGNYSLNGKTITLPGGMLVCDKKLAMATFYASEYNRYVTQYKYAKYMYDQYYDAAAAAEIQYQKKIADLEKSNKRSWLEQNLVYIGFICGIGMAVLTEYTVLHVK